MEINPTAVLALLSDLTVQLANAQAENAQLREQLAATIPPPPAPSPHSTSAP